MTTHLQKIEEAGESSETHQLSVKNFPHPLAQAGNGEGVDGER